MGSHKYESRSCVDHDSPKEGAQIEWASTASDPSRRECSTTGTSTVAPHRGNDSDTNSINHKLNGSHATGEDRAVRLFVGQIPTDMLEEDVTSLFMSHGVEIMDCMIIREKRTRKHRCCAFVTVPSRAQAENAVRTFHNRVRLNDRTSPMQVKEADLPKRRLCARNPLQSSPVNLSTGRPEVCTNIQDSEWLGHGYQFPTMYMMNSDGSYMPCSLVPMMMQNVPTPLTRPTNAYSLQKQALGSPFSAIEYSGVSRDSRTDWGRQSHAGSFNEHCF